MSNRVEACAAPLPLSGRADGSGRGQACGGPPARQWWRLGLAVAAGCGLAASFPPFDLPVLLPFALAALLLAIDDVTPRRAFYIGLACGYPFFAISLAWLFNIFGTASISLWAIAALFPALSAAAIARLRSTLPRLPLWLVAAVAWTGIEYFRSELMIPDFGWMGLGYAVVDRRLLAPFAAWSGSYGVTFLIVALAGVLAAGVAERRAGARLYAAALAAGYCLAMAIPVRPSAPARPLHVRLVQAGSEDDDDLFALSRRPGPRADLVVWPEYSFVHDPWRDAPLLARLTALPRQMACVFVFGAKHELDPADEAAYRNTAFVLDPSGRLIGTHVKNHTVHFIRDGIPGRAARAIATPAGRLGIAICFDLDYPDVTRRLTADGAECLIVPSDNPAEWGPLQHAQHRQLFQMRAVECGRWLATADVAGSTYVVAPNGCITAAVHTGEPAVLDATIGRLGAKTLYVRGGWRFGQVCLACLAALLCWSGLRRPAAGAAHARKR